MKTLKNFLFAVLALSMVTACSVDTPKQGTDHSDEQDLLKSKLLGEWVLSDQKCSYVYAFADNDTVYTKTTEGKTIEKWPYQPITADSIRIARNNWTTHNKVVFYSNDSIRINDFIPSDAAVSPPEFSDAVLIRHIATPPADRDLLKSKLTGEWVVSGEKDSYVYAFADNDMVYTKTTKGQTIDLWPYQTITGDSIRIIRNWRTTHNKIAFYSNDSIRIEDFILSNVYLPLPEFSDAVLIRFIATSPPEEKPDDILPACTNRTGHVLYYLTDHKTTILKEIPPYQSLSSCIVIAKLFDDTEPTAWLVGKFGLMTYFRICNYPQYAKEWDILENGLPVLLSGKVYPASFNPGFHTTDMAFSDLELTMLKNELP